MEEAKSTAVTNGQQSNGCCDHGSLTAGKEYDTEKLYPMVAVVQTTATSDKAHNLAVCSSLIRKAKLRGAVVIIGRVHYDFASPCVIDWLIDWLHDWLAAWLIGCMIVW